MSILFLLSDCERLISVYSVVKIILAVQRSSCPVLISNVCFLGPDIKEWLASSKELEWLLHCHHHQRAFFQTIWTGLDKRGLWDVFMVAQAVSFDLLWHHSYHLHVQWDLRIFYPEHFLKTPPCIISSAFWYIGCLCGIYKLHFGLIQKILPPYQSRVIFTSPCRIQRGAPGLTEFKPVVLENHDLKWWNYSAM